MSRVSIPYACENCDFEAEDTHCDKCDGIVFLYDSGKAFCSGCDMRIMWINCRNCEKHVMDL